MSRFRCTICDYVYDEEKEGKKFSDLPDTWLCPVCESSKKFFNKLADQIKEQDSKEKPENKDIKYYRERSRELLSGICSANKVCDGDPSRLCQGQKYGRAIGFGGAGQGKTFHNNFLALSRYKLKMRIVKKHAEPNLTTELFGKKLSMPVLAASVSGMKINFNDAIREIDFQEGMINGAKLAGTIGMSGNTPIYPENPGVEVIKENEGFGIPVFKPQSQDALKRLFQRAEDAHVTAIGVDLDGCGSTNWAMKGMPVYRKSAEELKEIVSFTDKPVFFKGIMCLEDGESVAESGAYALVVSNHGGRVMDYGQGIAEVLPKISEKYGNKIKILADGAVRTGYDVLRLLALGADAVLIGRELARMSLSGGAAAVQLYLEYVKKELRTAMLMTGCDNIKEIDKNILIGGR